MESWKKEGGRSEVAAASEMSARLGENILETWLNSSIFIIQPEENWRAGKGGLRLVIHITEGTGIVADLKGGEGMISFSKPRTLDA